MKLLFNCSTNIVGGGLKNSALFIRFALSDKELDCKFAISKPIEKLLNEWGINTETSFFKVFETSPARSKKARKELIDFSVSTNFDLVFTMAGPAYVKFSFTHLQGLSNPYISHADTEAFFLKGSIKAITQHFAKSMVQLWYSRWANYFVFQTQQARKSYCKRAFIATRKTFVVSNAFDNQWDLEKSAELESKRNYFRIVCPGAGYIHKSFQFIPKIAKEMVDILGSNVLFKFVLTLEEGDLLNSIVKEADDLGVASYVVNEGPFSYVKAQKIYTDTDLVFVPSLLETFSASYLESMATKKPLVVANKTFAKEVCQDYAQYIHPKKPKEAAIVLSKYVLGQVDLEKQYQNRLRIMNQFGDHQNRFNKLKNTFITIISQQDK